MKVTAFLLLAAAAIAPVVASGFEAEDSLAIRWDDEFESSFDRDFDLELEEREFEDDLFKREAEGSRFLKKAFGFGRKVGSSISPPQTPSETRELFEEEIYARGGTHHSGSSTHGSGSRSRSNSLSTADKNALNARISKMQKEMDMATSDYDREKLHERLAKLPGGVNTLKTGRSLDEMEPLEREYYDELD